MYPRAQAASAASLRNEGRTRLAVKRSIAEIADALVAPGRARLRILMYHSFTDRQDPDAAQMCTPLDLFRRQMAYLREGGYRVERASALATKMSEGVDPPAGSVCLTFDDGYRDQLAAVDILVELGYPVTLFVIAGRLRAATRGAGDAHLSVAELRDLLKTGLVQPGCHGMTHRPLRHLGDEELVLETAGAKREIEDALGVEAPLFAYPYGPPGSWDGRAVRALRRAGFLAAMTSLAGANDGRTDRFAWRRLRVSWQNDVPNFARLLRGSYDWYAWVQHLQSWRWRSGGREPAR